MKTKKEEIRNWVKEDSIVNKCNWDNSVDIDRIIDLTITKTEQRIISILERSEIMEKNGVTYFHVGNNVWSRDLEEFRDKIIKELKNERR